MFLNRSTDTEILLALYHEKRELMLDDLDGIFAFAIWDNLEETIFSARDRFGEKPFFQNKRIKIKDTLKLS